MGSMNKASLLLFMKRILESGSELKSSVSLKQLIKILEMQNADREMIRLVEETLESIPEAKDTASYHDPLKEEDLMIAIQRAKDRKRREEAMMNMGRCG